MFPRTSAAEIFPSDDDLIFRFGASFRHEPRRIQLVRKTNHRIGAELFVLFRNGWHQREILCRDNLVGIDIISDYINWAGNYFGHNLIGSKFSPQRHKGHEAESYQKTSFWDGPSD